MLTVQFENTGVGPFEICPDQLILQDAVGYLWSPGPQLAPGSRISGAVEFRFPLDAGVTEIMFQPENGRLLGLPELDASN
jgi:hypothetical protein